MTQATITFDDAYQQAIVSGEKPNILLGNGFSLALVGRIFSYDSLYNELPQNELKEARALFERWQTRNFEQVIDKLEDTVEVLNTYQCTDDKTIKAIADDAEALKRALLNAISNKHPEKAYGVTYNDGHRDITLTRDHFLKCANFLSKFEKTFTLSYDLLLYWVVCIAIDEDKKNAKGTKFRFDDGFLKKKGNGDLVMSWSYRQNMFYLHGGLHIFQGYDTDARKLRYNSANKITLIEQIREKFNRRDYPTTIAEGNGEKKLERIKGNRYLYRGYKKFKESKKNLFVLGASFSQDTHLIRAIAESSIEKLYFSVHCDNDETSVLIVKQQINDFRKSNKAIDIDIVTFNSSSANPWGNG